jgi:hypothetical protein
MARLNIDPAEEELRTIEDLRVLIGEIKKFWLMGDRHIIADAERALWRVLHSSAKRLSKHSRR